MFLLCVLSIYGIKKVLKMTSTSRLKLPKHKLTKNIECFIIGTAQTFSYSLDFLSVLKEEEHAKFEGGFRESRSW